MIKFIVIFLLSTFLCYSETYTIFSKVIDVKDGDTIVLDTENNITHKNVVVRLAYIDAPEKKQIGGQEAKDFLYTLIIGRVAKVIYNPEEETYGRMVAVVFVDNVNISEMMVQSGYAFVYYKYFGNEKSLADKYREWETNARVNKYGIWKNDYTETPEQFRKRTKSK